MMSSESFAINQCKKGVFQGEKHDGNPAYPAFYS
jgi:hypothetical protein